MKLLYAEDEKSLSEALVDILTFHKYSVDTVYDGAEALSFAQNEQYDGIILDIMMPKIDGIEVLKRLRAEGCSTPIMLLTAKSEIEDQISGLDLGADDYLPKPFSTQLLLAKLRAMLRRKDDYTPSILTFGNISLNQHNYELSCENKSVVLRKMEYQIMELFILNENRLFSTEEILCKIWGYETETELGSVWVHISTLRKRLMEIDANVTISVKRSLGYKLELKS